MRELGNSDSKVAEDLKKPGIYIWGFLYENKPKPTKKKYKLCDDHCNKKNNWKIVDGKKDNVIDKVYETIELGDNEQCSKLLFIPYYVGISTIDGVEDRLNEHKKMDSGHSAKYVRLKEEFMLCYHKHLFFLNSKREHSPALPIFPILKGTLNNNHVWTLLAKQGYVYHFNRQSTCMLIDHSLPNNMKFAEYKENGNYSITEYSQDFGNEDYINDNDPLKNRVKMEGNYNFWFTYCEIEDSSLIDYIKTKLIDVESKKDMNKSKLEELKDKKVKNESKLTELREKIKLIKEKPEKTNARLEKDDLEKENRTLNKDIQNLQKQGKNLIKQSEILQKDEEELKKKDEEDDKEKVRKKYFHQAEAATYFALRGITFSRTHTVEFPEGWKIQNNSGFNIFLDNAGNKKENNIRICTPKDEFNWPGYW